MATPHLEILVTIDVGPRIISLRRPGASNMFAQIPDIVIPTGEGNYKFRGGHRLWHAPEAMPRTYALDDSPIQVENVEDGLQFTQVIEPQTGIQKTIVVRLTPNEASVTIDHQLINFGAWPVTLAPWAITQLPLGGVALLPFAGHGQSGINPDRQLVLWPYTRLNDPRLNTGEVLIMIQGRQGPRFKLGFPNPTGWLAYCQGGSIFVKWAAYHLGQTYPDCNASSQCFVGEHFLELETLGPLVSVEPGQRVSHIERWALFEYPGLPPGDEAAAQELARFFDLPLEGN